jgi:hypothetical protein
MQTPKHFILSYHATFLDAHCTYMYNCTLYYIDEKIQAVVEKVHLNKVKKMNIRHMEALTHKQEFNNPAENLYFSK